MELSNNQNNSADIPDKALINLVKKYPLLYDAQNKHFRNPKKRHLCWNEIAKLLKTTNEYCRKRWLTLHKNWKQHISTIKKPFEYFEEMRFLVKDTMSQGETSENISDHSNLLILQVATTVLDQTHDQRALNGYCNFVAGNVRPVDEEQHKTVTVKVDLTEDDIDPDSCVHEGDPPQQRASSHEIMQMQVSNPPLPRKEQTSVINSTSGDNEDEFHIAGRRIGYQLKNVDDFQRTIAEKLISDIVFNAKMGNVTKNSAITLDATDTHHGHLPNDRRAMPM